MWSRAWLAGMVTAAACAPGPEDWPSGRPRIVELRFVEQRPQDALTLVFQVEFEDDNGDLGGGRLRLSVQDFMQDAIPLAEVFRAQIPPLDLDATEGQFEIFVQLQSDVADGARVRVGLELEDASGDRSNRPVVVLEAIGPGSDGGDGT